MKAASAAPKIKGGKLAKDLDWAKVVGPPRPAIPGAEVRTIGLPPRRVG
jgi:glycerate-2-kinase